MEKTETSVSFQDLRLDDFTASTTKQVRLYALLLTVRKNEKQRFVNQFLVSDLSINEECAYPIEYFDRGFQFKEEVYVEPNQKISVDVFDAKFKVLNEFLSRNFHMMIPTPGFDFTSELFNKKILVEIKTTVKRYKGQLDFCKAQMEPLTKQLLIKRAVTERDRPLIGFLNRLKVRISSEWVISLDSMYGFSDVMRRLNGVGYRQDNDSDILESQAPTLNKRQRLNPTADISDPSRALIASILPDIKQEILADHSFREEQREQRNSSRVEPQYDIPAHRILSPSFITHNESNHQPQTFVAHSTLSANETSERRVDPEPSVVPHSTTSPIFSQSTQNSESPFKAVVVIGCYPREELKIKNVHTEEIEHDDSFEIYVKAEPGDLQNPGNYKPVGIIKFKSSKDVKLLFDTLAAKGAPNFSVTRITLPTLQWKMLFSNASGHFCIYWDTKWDFEIESSAI